MRQPRSIPGSTGGLGGGDYPAAARLLSYLADSTRLQILAILAEGEQRVFVLCERLGRPQPSVSHHLTLLRRTGILTSRRRGKEVYYALASKPDPGQIGMRISLRGVTVTVIVDSAPATHAPPGMQEVPH